MAAGFLDSDPDPAETAEWLESLEAVLQTRGPERARHLLEALMRKAAREGVAPAAAITTPYLNTIPASAQPPYPGCREIERRIEGIVRWNATAMVVRANRECPGIGGHLATFASAATLYEVGYHHFFRGKGAERGGDMIYFQPHAAPGIYARAFLEGRLTEQQLGNFRRELQPGGGLSSYPHPWLMPGFWEFPTASMGLSALMAIYQARFNRYLQHRGLRDTSACRVWAFLGDGECDEPETVGALTVAAREQLDNLIFVVNCNLQRLDGPVRGNGQIIQELEAVFRGAGWNVIKVVWSGDWDTLLERDDSGALARRMGEVLDGEDQKYMVEGGAYQRSRFFGADPELSRMARHLSDAEIHRLRPGGHDPEKVFAAYRAAVDHVGSPTVILARTIKGYGLGEACEGRNSTHLQKKATGDQLRTFRDRFEIPIPDEVIDSLPFNRPPEGSPEMRYLRQRQAARGGCQPMRVPAAAALPAPGRELFREFLNGSSGREVSTTMAFTRMLARLLQDPGIGRRIVPIVADEARTFGMEALFSQVGIYSPLGQRYEPVDRSAQLFYREAVEGQILQEGVSEAGAMASWIAAGTAYTTHGSSMIPFFTFYSMFGFQRVGDLIWAAADSRARGFLLGATAGQTTLCGEGLQHQDGRSHTMALTIPNCMAYDPAFAYELAVILQDGMRRMCREGQDVFYYLTLYNESYAMPAIPEGAAEGILKGMYPLRAAAARAGGPAVQILGSGPILPEALHAQALLAERYAVGSTVWSVTSYKELRRDALETERWNRLHPDQPRRTSYLESLLEGVRGPFIAASDHHRALPDQIARWLPGQLVVLGTDGFGRSDSRPALRRFYEVDAAAIVTSALSLLAERGEIETAVPVRAMRELGVDPDQPAPWTM